jgi:CHAT domain-containing protein/Tfp pilus assembly protein PilF
LCAPLLILFSISLIHPQTQDELDKELFDAVFASDLDQVRAAVNKGANVDTKDENGWTALHWVVNFNQKELAEFLIKKGAKIDSKDNDNWTPLNYAVYKGHKNISKILIEKGASTNIKDRYGKTPLHQAILNEDMEMVRLLIKNGADVNERDNRNRTPIFFAISCDNDEMIEVLKKNGALINEQDKIELADLFVKKGLNAFKTRQFEKAIEYYKKAIEYNPTKVLYTTQLAEVLGSALRFKEAEEMLIESLNIFTSKWNQKEILRKLSSIHSDWVEYEMYVPIILHSPRESHDRYKSEALEREYRKKKDGMTLANRIGLTYIDLNQYDMAIKYFNWALELAGETKDKKSKGIALNNLGITYRFLSHYKKSIEYSKQALETFYGIKDKKSEYVALNNLGKVYSSLSQYENAIVYYEKGLELARETKNRTAECALLSSLGTAYWHLSQYQNAIKNYEQSLKIASEMKSKESKANALNNLGAAYGNLSRYSKAVEYFNQALKNARQVKDRSTECVALNNLGFAYNSLSRYEEAINFFEQSLKIAYELKNKTGEGITLNNIAAVLTQLGQFEKAIKYFEQALKIASETKDRFNEGVTLNKMGKVYLHLKQYHEAIDLFENALKVAREVRNKFGEARALNNLGETHCCTQQYEKALNYLHEGLKIAREVKDKEGESSILNHLMLVWKNLKVRPLAIFYGKQSINIIQELRGDVKEFPKVIQEGFLESKEEIYRELADFLLAEGWILAAQQVLNMLKEEEYFGFIRKDVRASKSLNTNIDFTRFEQKWIEKYKEIMKKISKTGSEMNQLRDKVNKTEKDKTRILKISEELKKANRAFNEYMVQLKKAFVRESQKNSKDNREEAINLASKARALQSTLRYLDKEEGKRNAALHYLVFGGRVSVIITTPEFQLVKKSEIEEKELNQLIMDFRGSIKTGAAAEDVNQLGHKLYHAVFKGADEELKKYGATTVMVYLDGVLRYIPLSILWDGKNYLLQRYMFDIFTTSSLTNIKDVPVEKRNILGMGASRGGSGFPPLPHVRKEIESIVNDKNKGFHGLINGEALIDEEFAKKEMIRRLKIQSGFPYVHIASHFKFNSGDESKSYLLLGDGTVIKLNELREEGDIFYGVDLLVLSACQTGLGGNGKEIDGFGELAQQSGAKSVVATLWQVADESTRELMSIFYLVLKENQSKSKLEALRQAQLELAGLNDLLEEIDESKDVQPHLKDKAYNHPYFWGGFIMMGNWR